MKPVGGFFELELGASHAPYHDGAVTLCSGRACLRRILTEVKTPRALVPFFICDSALTPFISLGIPYEFYRLGPTLEPILETRRPEDVLLYVNYFGLKAGYADRLVTKDHQVIIDDSQAFFRRGEGSSFSFNSARKFFGVPDGAYAYGPGLLPEQPLCRVEAGHYDHLVNRLLGRQELAFRQYVEHETQVSGEVLAPSLLAARLLATIDYDAAEYTRRRNFEMVHKRLGSRNQLEIDLDDLGSAVPFCYPFLPRPVVPHQVLWRRNLFVPQLWPEVLARPGADFDWERDLARRLLPLPVDQRYGVQDMDRLCSEVLEVLG